MEPVVGLLDAGTRSLGGVVYPLRELARVNVTVRSAVRRAVKLVGHIARTLGAKTVGRPSASALDKLAHALLVRLASLVAYAVSLRAALGQLVETRTALRGQEFVLALEGGPSARVGPVILRRLAVGLVSS